MTIVIEDARAARMKQIRKDNKQTVKDWWEAEEKPSIMRCCSETGLSYPTVKRSLNELILEQGGE